MAFDFAVFAALALALGFKHAFDVDHVVAVSNLLTRRSRVRSAAGLAASWAVGHLVTASLVSLGLFVLADSFLPSVVARLELLVPLMLLVIGAVGLGVELRRLHYHRHAHATSGEHGHFHLHLRSPRHEHGAMAGIGVVHGLASNDELLVVLLVALGAAAWWQVVLGIALFSFGVLAGMVLYAAAVHVASGPVTRRFGWNWVPAAFTAAFSLLSIAYGAWLLSGGEGLNLVEGWLGR